MEKITLMIADEKYFEKSIHKIPLSSKIIE
jgi:hypothetical protein